LFTPQLVVVVKNAAAKSMDVTVYVQTCGTTACFALCLDLLPHQISAMAHTLVGCVVAMRRRDQHSKRPTNS